MSSTESPLTRRQFLAGSAASASATILKPSVVWGSQANSRITVGLVGLGQRGQLIAGLLATHAGYQVVAAADYFPDVTAAAADPLQVPRNRQFSGLLGYKRLLEHEMDAVLLEAPPYAFPDHAAAAVDAGRHVYMAKPVAVDVPGCLRIAALGRRSTQAGRVFFVDFQMRTDPFTIEVVRRVHDGVIGPLSIVGSHYSSEGFPDPEKTATIESRLQKLIWVNDIALGGGHLVNAGIHAIDAALWLAGRVPVSAMGCTRTARANPHGDTPDVDALVFQFENGLVVNHIGEHVRNTHEFKCMAWACGRDGYAEVSYTGQNFLRGNNGGYKGGPAENLYVEGIKRNLDTFHAHVTPGVHENATVEPSVNATLATILGREAGARNGLVTWEELIEENKPVPADLRGLTE